MLQSGWAASNTLNCTGPKRSALAPRHASQSRRVIAGAMEHPRVILHHCLSLIRRGKLQSLVPFLPSTELAKGTATQQNRDTNSNSIMFTRLIDEMLLEAPSKQFLDSYALRNLVISPPATYTELSSLMVDPRTWVCRTAVQSWSGEEAILTFHLQQNTVTFEPPYQPDSRIGSRFDLRDLGVNISRNHHDVDISLPLDYTAHYPYYPSAGHDYSDASNIYTAAAGTGTSRRGTAPASADNRSAPFTASTSSTQSVDSAAADITRAANMQAEDPNLTAGAESSTHTQPYTLQQEQNQQGYSSSGDGADHDAVTPSMPPAWRLLSVRGEPLHVCIPKTPSPEFPPESVVLAQLAALKEYDFSQAYALLSPAAQTLVGPLHRYISSMAKSRPYRPLVAHRVASSLRRSQQGSSTYLEVVAVEGGPGNTPGDVALYCWVVTKQQEPGPLQDCWLTEWVKVVDDPKLRTVLGLPTNKKKDNNKDNRNDRN